MLNRKIVKIVRSKSYSDRIIIILENKNVLRVPEDVFILKSWRKGDEVTAEDIEEFSKAMRFQEARDAGYRLLGYRMRSVAEMKRRLKDKSFTSLEIDTAINRMIKLDYLNDEKFGKAFVKDKVRSKKIGPIALRSELMQHYFSADLVNRLCVYIYNKFPIEELIIEHFKKKKIKKKLFLSSSEKQKFNNYLLRKGFGWNEIENAYTNWETVN